MGKRGIVITPQYEEIDKGIKGGPVVNPRLFRQYLVYWDEIVIVNLPPIMGFEVQNLSEKNIDFKVAINSGRLKLANHSVHNKNPYYIGDIAEDFRIGQQKIAFENTQIYDGYWAIGQSIKRLQLSKTHTVEKEVIASKLHQALPVPGLDISAEKIIKFREDRDDLFKDFRKRYDDLYTEIIQKGDQQLALQNAVEQIQSSLIDIRRVMEEDNLNPTQISSQTFWSVIADTLKTVAAASIFFEDLFLKTMIGAVNMAISLNLETQQQPDPMPNNIEDYAYLYCVEKELGSKDVET